MKIVFAGPQEFHWNADFLGDRGGLQHVVVGEAAAKSSANAANVQGDIAFVHFEQLRDLSASTARSLTRRPQLQLAVFVMRQTILRLERRVRDERIGVGSLD